MHRDIPRDQASKVKNCYGCPFHRIGRQHCTTTPMSIPADSGRTPMSSNPDGRFLLIAKWPCEDLSASGKGRGLTGRPPLLRFL
jgi:hypothetical protein